MRLIHYQLLAACSLQLSFPEAANATVFASTRLRDNIRNAQAAVQGTLISAKTLHEPSGTPWTILTFSVEMVLAGELEGSQFSVRCLGGAVTRPEPSVLSLSGAPVFFLGESVVFYYTPGSVCDFSGFENGVFWRRVNASGDERLVNHRDQAISSIAEDGPVFSGELVPRPPRPDGELPQMPQLIGSPAVQMEPAVELPPAADATLIIDELFAFNAVNMPQAGRVVSTNDLTNLPDLRSSRAPSDSEKDVSK